MACRFRVEECCLAEWVQTAVGGIHGPKIYHSEQAGSRHALPFDRLYIPLSKCKFIRCRDAPD
jgi:hypothetical protein